MKYAISLSIALLASASASAAIPQFRASCPTGILAAGGGSAVFINGKQATVKDYGNNNFSASANGVSLDLDFTGGEPTLSYTAKGGANGICTITKFQPAAPPASRQASGGGASASSMAAECKGFASEKFGVRPAYVTVHPAMRDHGMYSMYGVADDKNFICTFDGSGKFIGVDPTGNPDGDA